MTADAALGLGLVSRFADEYDRARRWFSRAHAGYVATGNRSGEAQAIRGAAGIAANLGDFIAAGEHNTESGRDPVQVAGSERSSRYLTSVPGCRAGV